MKRNYSDDYRGWPVAPRNKQHPIRGSFLDPRPGGAEGGDGYHPGVDVAVRDDKPEAGAPPGRTHRVYALEGGRVWKAWLQPPPGKEGIVRVGHFGYGHILPERAVLRRRARSAVPPLRYLGALVSKYRPEPGPWRV